MKKIVLCKTYQPPPVCEKEIFRYMGSPNPDSALRELIDSAIAEGEKAAEYKVCYCELPLDISGNDCKIGESVFSSANLSKLLSGCDSAIVFAATLGAEFDRLIIKYSKISPSKALALQAFGTERIEALCDAFCKDIEAEKRTPLTHRFSAGYGDLPLKSQREIFEILDCSRKIGLTLNDSFSMSPSKSVTAILGVGGTAERVNKNKCENCQNIDCIYRG